MSCAPVRRDSIRRVPTIAAFLDLLDEIAPWAKAGGWDPVGLQIGDPARQAHNVAVCHEVTPTVAAAAAEHSVDLLVAYHPLLFRPTARFVAGSGPGGRALRLAEAGIALAVVHTAYDVVPGGVADALADALGLGDVAPFGPNWGDEAAKVVTFVPAADVDRVARAMSRAGAGTIGGYTGCSFRTAGIGTFVAGRGANPATGTAGAANAEPEVRIEMIAPLAQRDAVVAALVDSHPYEEAAYDVYTVQANAGFIGRIGEIDKPETLGALAERVAATLASPTRVAGDRARLVRRVAVVPGSGRSFLRHAAAADVMVTGDVGHHDARLAGELGVAVIDPGHAATERPGVAKLYAAVAQVAPEALDLTGVDPDPWQA